MGLPSGVVCSTASSSVSRRFLPTWVLRMALYVFSDLHIQSAQDPLYARVLSLLAQLKDQDAVVLNGDIFDLFVGNKSVYRQRYRAFLDALRAAGARGAKIHYVEGNHDFLLARPLSEVPNLELHASEVSFNHQGRRFFVAHGDRIDPTDYGYRFMRWCFRSWLMKLVVWLLPGALIDAIGRGSSRWSRGSEIRLPSDWPIADRERLRSLYRTYARHQLDAGHDYVILGHCHDLDEEGGRYFNMGFPPIHGSYLYWDSTLPQPIRKSLE